MRVECHFDFYDLDSLTLIVKQRADACGWRYESEDILKQIAARSKETPRLAMKLLTAVWRVCRSEDTELMTQEHLDAALGLEQLDALGLDIWQQRYLCVLAENCVETRLNVIASSLGLPTKSVMQIIEPYLLRQRLVSKTERGRSITDRGVRHLRGEPV
jgi:Holliday junction DNA helicase RuvB